MNRNKIILDLCGGTGAWSRPYSDAGYDVRVITTPQYDVRTYIAPGKVHGVLAAPPCTEFARCGARWRAGKDPKLLEEALEIVDACLNIIKTTDPVWWALENPIGRLKRLRYHIIGEPLLTFDPCDYGDPYTKKTLLWGVFNIPLKNPVPPEGFRKGSPNTWYCKVWGKSPKAKEYRSLTPPGFAKAFFEANP